MKKSITRFGTALSNNTVLLKFAFQNEIYSDLIETLSRNVNYPNYLFYILQRLSQ